MVGSEWYRGQGNWAHGDCCWKGKITGLVGQELSAWCFWMTHPCGCSCTKMTANRREKVTPSRVLGSPVQEEEELTVL